MQCITTPNTVHILIFKLKNKIEYFFPSFNIVSNRAGVVGKGRGAFNNTGSFYTVEVTCNPLFVRLFDIQNPLALFLSIHLLNGRSKHFVLVKYVSMPTYCVL